MTTEKTEAAYDPNFQSYYQGIKDAINSELKSLLPTIDELKLQRQIKYALQTNGKRLRATLVLLSGESAGGNREHLRKLALAIELLHLATLVHDDILDEDLFRRNTLSVYAKWNVKEAILVGDILAALALALCKGYEREILNVMIDTCMQLSDGEYNDVELAKTTLSENEYLRKIEKKSASLFKAACECGALAANGSPNEITALRFFGENYGLAYQIRDDVLDAEASKNDLQPDANKFRATLPIIHAYENSNNKKQALLKGLLSTKTQESLKAFLNELSVNSEKSDSLSYCASKVDLYADKAVAGLSPLKESIFKDYLIQMAESLKLKEPNFGIQKIYL
ncbi:MAG: polyprenyl synthetase family protein [Candidatus Bathyarchaeia archaeon]